MSNFNAHEYGIGSTFMNLLEIGWVLFIDNDLFLDYLIHNEGQ
jgi:hypothetical protein